MNSESEHLKEPEPCINLSLKKADRVINNVYNKYLSECGLSVSQFSAMRVINFVGVCTAQIIQDILILDQTTLSRNMKRMVSDGLVAMKEDKLDRRRKLLSLTPKGKTLFDAGERQWQLAQKEIRGVLGEDVADTIIRLSDVVVEKCAAHYNAPVGRSKTDFEAS